MKLLLVAVLSVLCAQAQVVIDSSTLIAPVMLRWTTGDAQAGNGTVRLVGLYGGRFVKLLLGTGLTVRALPTGEVVIEGAAAPASNIRPQYGLRAAKLADGSWEVATPAGVVLDGAVAVYLNGVRQTEGVDYARTSRPNAVQPLPNTALATLPLASSPSEWEIVTFDYPVARSP